MIPAEKLASMVMALPSSDCASFVPTLLFPLVPVPRVFSVVLAAMAVWTQSGR
jgi:hypothetical protein